MTEQGEQIRGFVEARKEKYCRMSDAIWDAAETGFQEKKSAEILIKELRDEGFTVEEGVDGMPTAFIGTWGNKKPVIALLAEYDALPGLSQKAGVAEKKPVISEGAGHGCGHNLLGAGAVAGAIAAKACMEKYGLSGTIRLYGCPAEESGASKVFLARDGFFDDVDMCFNWHPGGGNYVRSTASNAVTQGLFTFRGKAAHAAAAPHLGRSALDACELMSVGVNYLREHIIPEARIHYAYQNSGGKAANVVQDHTEVLYMIRAPKVEQSRAIAARVADVARGAALMTGTKVTVDFFSGMCDFLPNSEASKILSDALLMFGAPDFDEADRAFAQKFCNLYSKEEVDVVLKRMGDFYPDPELFRKSPLIEVVVPYTKSRGRGAGSTDVGDVSYCTPTALLKLTSYANGTAGHTWQMVAQMKSSVAHKSMIRAAEILALATVMAVQSPERIKAAQEEYIQETGGKYVCCLDSHIRPAI